MLAASGPEVEGRRFVIHPNRSLSWRGNCVFIAFLSVVLALVALGFVLVGLWVVAPFAGLELLLVAGVLYGLHRRSRFTETVDVSAPFVTISVARDRPQSRMRLPRSQSRVILCPSSRRGHPSRLYIASRDLGVEVGRCLGEDERQGLASALRAVIHAPPGSWPDDPGAAYQEVSRSES